MVGLGRGPAVRAEVAREIRGISESWGKHRIGEVLGPLLEAGCLGQQSAGAPCQVEVLGCGPRPARLPGCCALEPLALGVLQSVSSLVAMSAELAETEWHVVGRGLAHARVCIWPRRRP